MVHDPTRKKTGSSTWIAPLLFGAHLWGDMKRPTTTLPFGNGDEVTKELTGNDADMDEAATGDAGSGASPFGADFTGGFPEPIEDPPDQPSDIVPDQVERWPEIGEEKERELTAQQAERPPVDLSRLP